MIKNMLKNNNVLNVEPTFKGFNYNPGNDSIILDELEFKITGNLNSGVVTGILSTIKELEVIKINVRKRTIVF